MIDFQVGFYLLLRQVFIFFVDTLFDLFGTAALVWNSERQCFNLRSLKVSFQQIYLLLLYE